MPCSERLVGERHDLALRGMTGTWLNNPKQESEKNAESCLNIQTAR